MTKFCSFDGFKFDLVTDATIYWYRLNYIFARFLLMYFSSISQTLQVVVIFILCPNVIENI